MSLSFTSETESSGCQARTSVRPSALLLPSKENYNNLFPCFAFRTLFSISLFHRYLPFYRILYPLSLLNWFLYVYICNRLLYLRVYLIFETFLYFTLEEYFFTIEKRFRSRCCSFLIIRCFQFYLYRTTPIAVLDMHNKFNP